MRFVFGLAGFTTVVAACASATAGPGAGLASATPAPPSANAAVKILQSVCLPLIEGGNLQTVARSAGLTWTKGEWVLRIDRHRRIDLTPPDAANPRVCSATIVHGVGAGPAIRSAIDQWARAASPGLTPVKVEEESKGPNYLRVTSTWEGDGPMGAIGVALSEEKTLQGGPVDRTLDQSALFVSLTPKGT